MKKLRPRVQSRVIGVVPKSRQVAARKQLKALRKRARVGDLMSPSGEIWNAELYRALSGILKAPDLSTEEAEVRTAIGEFLSDLGFDDADALAAEIAEEFRAFQVSLAEQPLSVKTSDPGTIQSVVRDVMDRCKRVWLEERMRTMVRRATRPH